MPISPLDARQIPKALSSAKTELGSRATQVLDRVAARAATRKERAAEKEAIMGQLRELQREIRKQEAAFRAEKLKNEGPLGLIRT
jgi:hypothetical protein